MKRFITFVTLLGLSAAVFAQNALSSQAPLRKVSLFSSGVGYFERRGTVDGSGSISLPFAVNAVNDALKSLVINDPSSSPTVAYTSENTLSRTLRGLKVDLSGDDSLPGILRGLKGAEVTIFSPQPVTGRIVGVEERVFQAASSVWERRSVLTLLTSAGALRSFPLDSSIMVTFSDPVINSDFHKALDLIIENRDTQVKTLTVNLPGGASREVTVSYVIATPVWKVSYRLDLGQNAPFLQGWAIVDNDGEEDWKEVELSLVTGKPVSFIQNLYPPYYQARPTLPLAIAGVAGAVTYESTWGGGADDVAGEAYFAETPMREPAPRAFSNAAQKTLNKMAADTSVSRAERGASIAGGSVETAAGQAAGEQFEFTMKRPVTLARQRSAMLPLVEGTIQATKTLVFPGAKAVGQAVVHPAISAQLTNTTGMKLPAGPVTVFDAGNYAGDALLSFFSEGEKRLISWGDDLSVSGSAASEAKRNIYAVTISGGVMTLKHRHVYTKTYTIKNFSPETKSLVIEHPVTSGATLAEPAAEERTANTYRFARNLPGQGTVTLTVNEETPTTEKIILTRLDERAVAAYASNEEIPANVREAFSRAVELKNKVTAAQNALSALETKKASLTGEQERIRRNLEAAGRDTPQGQEYLRRMTVQDGEFDTLAASIAAGREEVRAAQAAYDAYIANMSL